MTSCWNFLNNFINNCNDNKRGFQTNNKFTLKDANYFLDEGAEPEERNTERRIVATDKTIRQLVSNEIRKQGPHADLNHIDVSRVTDMSWMFRESKFNGGISDWDVSNVTDMRSMFQGSAFNSEIGNWNDSSVTDMEDMFDGSKFDCDINDWDVSHVTNMEL